MAFLMCINTIYIKQIYINFNNMKFRLYIFIQCIVCTILFFSLKPLFFSFLETNTCNLVVTDVLDLAQTLSIFNFHPLL